MEKWDSTQSSAGCTEKSIKEDRKDYTIYDQWAVAKDGREVIVGNLIPCFQSGGTRGV